MGQTLVEYQKEIWSVGIVLLTFLINRIFRLKPRLLYSVGHSFNLLVEQPLVDEQGQQISPHQLVRTASITVGNNGLQPAKSVEVTFNWRPPFFNVWPARRFDEAVSAFNRFTLQFDSVAPNEQFQIEIMSINAELPVITAVRSEDCVGKLVAMAPQRVYPTWITATLGFLVLLGAAAIIYIAIATIQFIAA